uniref:immunoglobulin lambda-like polypeptide 5 n=1 Tax=Phascolarctos cinereus TaxID=38626 RepID=UPI000A289D85|nr:immunoglobulin lambda-like polypeptide 5 [Phascolarctos cinereus]
MTLRGTGSEFFDRKRTAGNMDYEQIRERNEDILLSQPIRLQRKDPVQFWALQCNKDIAKLDTVQSRAASQEKDPNPSQPWGSPALEAGEVTGSYPYLQGWTPPATPSPTALSHALLSCLTGFQNKQTLGAKGHLQAERVLVRLSITVVVFGGGTQLTVIGQPAVAPTVNAFAPSQEELATKKATLVCLLSGFYPRTVEVAWTKDGSPVSQGVETSQPSRQSDSKYSASSYLSLSADQWLSADTFTCKVTHDGKVIQKELSPEPCWVFGRQTKVTVLVAVSHTFTCKVTQDGKVIQKEISSSQST